MRASNSSSTVVNPVSEARRYVQNAKDILIEKADLDPETQLYRDKKYVRMAGTPFGMECCLSLRPYFR